MQNDYIDKTKSKLSYIKTAEMFVNGVKAKKRILVVPTELKRKAENVFRTACLDSRGRFMFTAIDGEVSCSFHIRDNAAGISKTNSLDTEYMLSKILDSLANQGISVSS